MQRHHQNSLNWAHVHTRWIGRCWNTVIRNTVTEGCACTVREINTMLTVRDSVMVWAAIAHGYRSPLVVIDGNLNAQLYRDDILVHHVIPLFHNNANISIFQHDNATSHTARDTVNFHRTNNIDFIDDWPANSPDRACLG